MESVETFVERFTKAWNAEDNNDLARIFKDVRKYLQHVSKVDCGRTLEIIFDEQKGLFKIIDSILGMQKIQMNKFSSSLKEAFAALNFILGFSMKEYEPYIQKTRDSCFLCVKTFCWHYSRKTAAETLAKLMESFPNHDLQLDEIVKHYNDFYLRAYTKKEGCILYIIIGAIAKYCPKTNNMIRSADSIFHQLMLDLKSQCIPDADKQPEEVIIYIECFSNMLTNFVPFEEDNLKKMDFFKNLYFYLSLLCEPNRAQKVYRNKAIYILSIHKDHFSYFIYSDYKKWHALFESILEEDQSFTIISAVRVFYEISVSNLLKENEEDTFLFFKNHLTSKLCSRNISSPRLRLIIYGFGEFSSAYAKYSPTEIHEMFQMIALRALPFYSKENEENLDFEAVVDFLQTLSKILNHIPNVSFHQIHIVTELSIHFTKRYPELTVLNKNHASNALKITFLNVSQLEKNLQQEYFSSLFREGILWSCSHTLLVDVELQREIQNLQEDPVCYKNYLPLWVSLFHEDELGRNSRELNKQIFNEFIIVLMTFIDKLNLNVKSQENDSVSDMESTCLKAEKESDFRFFINLVDLYTDVFHLVASYLFENLVEKLLIFLMKCSYKYPLISGFYKVLGAIFKVHDIFIDYDNILSKSTLEMIPQYLSDVLELVSKVSGELQLSCVHLILSTPSFFIKNLINNMIPVFKVAFNIGLTDVSLAFMALQTLEDWIKNTDIKCSRSFLKNIIYFINPYLSTDESLIDMVQNITKKRRVFFKKATLLHDGENLQNLQKKILLFYGSLDTNILLDFVHEKSIVTDASWNDKRLLQSELLFPDIRLEMYFDRFIPRVIELTKSGDRKTKVSACELLHAFITIILGNKLIDQCFTKNLCRAILKLGCDPDDAVKNLYHPLIIQLTHYLSSKLMKESTVPQEFIDCLFEDLSEELNPSLRECCGLYLKEFTQWSIKQSVERNLTNLPNVRSIVRRITNYALYPSNEKRLAAAISFNYLYTILREDINIVNTYWLEFFFAFVKGMEECDNIQIIKALDHVEKVIRVKSNTFNSKSPNRRKPSGFSGETLEHALIWLFEYCGSANTKCRWKCMELFENLLPLIPENESIKNALAHNVDKIVKKNVEQNFESTLTVNSVTSFIRILDFYTWILQKQFLPLMSLSIFKNSLDQEDIFIKQFNKFVSSVNENAENIDGLNQNNSLETKELINVTNKLPLKMLEFISTILTVKEKNVDHVLWTNEMNSLISRCTLYPHKIGLTPKNFQIIEKLPKQIEILLSLMMKYLPEIYLEECKRNILLEAKKNALDYLEIQDIIDRKKDIETLQDFTKGLLILRKCRFVNFETEFHFTNSYLEHKINVIFESVKNEIMGKSTCKLINEHVKDYLNGLMHLFFEDYQAEIIRLLVALILKEDPLECSNGSTVTHGEYFLEIFKNPLLGCMMKDPVETMKILDESLMEFPDKLFYLIEELLVFTQRSKSVESEIFANEIIKRCDDYQRLLNGLKDRKIKLFNINRIAVTVKTKPFEVVRKNGSSISLYSWIIEELVRTKDLEEKTMILRNFLVCLADSESTERNTELLLVFKDLREENSVDYLEKLESNELLRFQSVSCFQVLLKMLVDTKSLTVYEAVIKYAAGIYKCVSKDDIKCHLKSYFGSVSNANALKCLQTAYKLFIDMNFVSERLDVLKQFLLPSMEMSKSTVIKQFYEDTCQETIQFIREKIDNSMHIADQKRLIVTKIGCYNMFELLFAKFELGFINVKDPVTNTDKPLNQILVQQTVEVVRRFSSNQAKNLTRLLHCAALNCCISLISLKEEERFYKFIFMEDRASDQLLWERIVDCERLYNFSQTSSAVRRSRNKLINIRRAARSEQDPVGPSASYFHRYDLTSLTLVEDLHAYDLNDTTVLAEAKPSEEDRRLDMSFEHDVLNEHECMPMICGVLAHMFNSEISSLPEDGRQVSAAELPDYLKHFKNAFLSQKDNVRLFLMKIISNTKNAFVPHVKAFFTAIAAAVCGYLKGNALNYVVRDILVILIESKFEVTEDAEKNAAQQLVQHLIEKASDTHSTVYKYNLELIESLCKQWSGSLECPQNLLDIVLSDPDLAVKVVVILLRSNEMRHKHLMQQELICKLVRTQAEKFKDNESSVLLSFEALGWLLRFADEASWLEELARINALLVKVKKHSRDRCARCVCAVYRSCRSETRCKELFRFATPALVTDSHKHECVELLNQRIIHMDPVNISIELALFGLDSILREHLPGCEEPALKTVLQVLPSLDERQLKLYVELALRFTSPASNVVEHRILAYSIAVAAYPLTKDLCTRALLAALDDPADEVKQLVLDFWKDKLGLPNTCCERLLELINMYAPELQAYFPRFLCLLMLELTSKSHDASRPMFKSLIECSFRDYEVLVPRRRMNLGSMAPLFAPSLASQLDRASRASSSQQSSFAGTLKLLATNEPEFKPTQEDAHFVVPRNPGSQYKKIPDPSQNKLSWRIITAPSEISRFQNQEMIQKKLEIEMERRRNSAKIYRKYRIGDFPDVEILHSSFVESLKQFILKDWLSCKDLVVALTCGIIDRLKDSDKDKYEVFMDKIIPVFKSVLLDNEEKNNFAPAVMEIVLHSKALQVDPNAVGRICKSMKIDSLGILLLEEVNMDKGIYMKENEEPPIKRIKLYSNKENWAELASLYKAIGETDVVNSIFSRQNLFTRELREGALAQAENSWLTAKKWYGQAYEISLGAEKEHCLESMFECLSQLSSWNEINKRVEVILDGNYENIWESPKKKQLLPWIFEAQLHKALEDLTSNKGVENNDFFENFDAWIQNHEIPMKKAFGEEISLFYLSDKTKEEKARHTLNCCLDYIREQWIHATPLAENVRAKILLKLRGIHNIDAYIKTLKSPELEFATKDLISYWDQHLPSLNEDLLSWNKHITYRLTFAHLLHAKFYNEMSESYDDECEFKPSDLLAAGVRQRIKIGEIAMKNKNNTIAKKHTVRIEKILGVLDKSDYPKLHTDFILTASKYKFLCGEIESSIAKKVNYYVQSWQLAENTLEDEEAGLETKIKLKYHLFDLTSSLEKQARENTEFTNILMSEECVQSYLSPFKSEMSDDDDSLKSLKKYIFNSLKSACEEGTDDQLAESYAKFGKYCYSLLYDNSYFDCNLVEEFISSILTGMSWGSSEAAHYFPCLLKQEYYQDNQRAVELFIAKSEQVQSWLFLPWQAQIMSYLGKSLDVILIPVVQRLVRDYPCGVMYNFQMIFDARPELKLNQEICHMYKSLFRDSRIDLFFEAMHRVCQPEFYLKYYLEKLFDSDEVSVQDIESLIDKVFGEKIRESNLQGLIYKELDKYRTKLEELKTLDPHLAKKYSYKIRMELYTNMKSRLTSSNRQAHQLKEYTPYLSQFSGEDFEIEIPGQYVENRKPILRYHIKISRFDKFVRVMYSNCNPIKIKMIGNDAKSYSFLVKFGEDLRQDERLQQIFRITNKILDNDVSCRKRYLAVNNYHVVPFSTSVGLIQWVDETKSLSDFIKFSIADADLIPKVIEKYQNWITESGSSGLKSQCYKTALLKYSSEDVVLKMNQLKSYFEKYYLKETFAMLSPSLEAFISLRRNFITSYATMCTAHWIIGVGDRHPENMLIEIKTGKCYGIDFGCAFGAGIDQSVPELVPFRLTAQILGLFKPFDEQALFGRTMTHVLSALRKERGPILACLDVFIHEPLDWGKHVKHVNKRLHEDGEVPTDVKWLPKRKIAIVDKKLNGTKPSTVMVEELSYNYDDNANEYFKKYKNVINGTDGQQMSLRSMMEDESLSPEQQVQCLLEQAKDLNALGRMWVGWCPFM